MKGGKAEEDGVSADRLWLSVRVSAAEKTRLQAQADAAGLSLSAYLRRRFFGGRPIVARTDLGAVAELRRIGGLLKHNFETLRRAGVSADIILRQEEALGMLVGAIQRIAAGGDDHQENREPEDDADEGQADR